MDTVERMLLKINLFLTKQAFQKKKMYHLQVSC